MAKAGLLFAGTDDGTVLFSNPGAVGRWLRIGQELRGRVVRAIWPAIDNPLVVFAAAGDIGLQRSDDGGQSWRQVLDADVSTIAGHHSAPEVLYLGGANGQVYRSEDAGARWERFVSGERPAGAARVVVAHADARQLYVGTGDGAWTSADGGDHWSRYGTGLDAVVGGLAEAPTVAGLLYAVSEGALYRCAGAGEQWERVDAARPAGSAAFAILAGKDAVLLLALADGGLGRSADDGATWTAVGADSGWSGGVTALIPARYHIDTAFAGSGGGEIAISADRGRTWQMLKQDLAPVRSIAAARLA